MGDTIGLGTRRKRYSDTSSICLRNSSGIQYHRPMDHNSWKNIIEPNAVNDNNSGKLANKTGQEEVRNDSTNDQQ